MILAEWCAWVTEANPSTAIGKPSDSCQSQVIFAAARTQPFTNRLLSTLCLAGTFLINLFCIDILVIIIQPRGIYVNIKMKLKLKNVDAGLCTLAE